MNRYVTDYLKTCIKCQQYKASNQKPAGLLQTPVLQRRMKVLAIDLFGPLPPAAQGHKWIRIVEDYATRWVELFTLVEATGETCAWTLVNEVCLRYGLSRRLNSDNGGQFISDVLQKVAFCVGIEQSFVPRYHPEANPVERKNRDLKTQLAIQLGDTPHPSWPEKLPSIRFAMNMALCESSGYTPAFLMLGRELRTIDDVTHDLRSVVQSENFVAEATPRLLQLGETLEIARETHERRQDQQKALVDQSRHTGASYSPGDLLMVQVHPLSNAQKGYSAKFAPKRNGPYVNLKVHGPTSFEIADRNHPDQSLGTYHASQLTPYHGPPEETPALSAPLSKRGRPKKVHPGPSVRDDPRVLRGRFQHLH